MYYYYVLLLFTITMYYYYYVLLLLYYIQRLHRIKIKSFRDSLQTHLKSSRTNSIVDNGGGQGAGGPKGRPAKLPTVYDVLYQAVHYCSQYTNSYTIIKTNRNSHESGPKPPSYHYILVMMYLVDVYLQQTSNPIDSTLLILLKHPCENRFEIFCYCEFLEINFLCEMMIP